MIGTAFQRQLTNRPYSHRLNPNSESLNWQPKRPERHGLRILGGDYPIVAFYVKPSLDRFTAKVDIRRRSAVKVFGSSVVPFFVLFFLFLVFHIDISLELGVITFLQRHRNSFARARIVKQFLISSAEITRKTQSYFSPRNRKLIVNIEGDAAK